jgi:branched-chain amino acid transport system substrate-binding protein
VIVSVAQRIRLVFGLLVVAAVLVLTGCGSGGGSGATSASGGGATTSAASSTGSGSSSVSTSSCGPKAGVKATGTPIRLGTIDVKQPGTDFTDISNMAAAYYACVNANGGVNGHPIKLYALTDASNPAQIAAEAKKLVQGDHVIGMTGNTDLIECTIDSAYWQKLGFKVIAAGIAPECYSTPNYTDVNMGARYSSDGAGQYVIAHGAKKVVFDQSNVPGTGYNAAGIVAIAKAAHVPVVNLTENVPINDASSVALKEVNAAGPDGSVVLNFTPPEALVILQAAQKLGLEGRVKSWACATPCNTDFLAKALGPKWEHKFFVNAELTPPDTTNTPTMNLYRGILKQYGSSVSGGVGSFSQMGFTIAEIATHALESVKGPYTVKSVNQAFENVKNYDTGMLCKPWTYGPYALHVANNTDYTVTPANGKMVIAQGCTAISAVDPGIAQYRKAVGAGG